MRSLAPRLLRSMALPLLYLVLAPVAAPAQEALVALCDETNPKQLCLNDGRFAVTASWATTDGASGTGNAVKLTDDSGYFWFFDASNIEVVTKVLNGCANNNAYWVFAAGLTNVEVRLTVTDLARQTSFTRDNPQGTPFVPIQETTAFPTSCP